MRYEAAASLQRIGALLEISVLSLAVERPLHVGPRRREHSSAPDGHLQRCGCTCALNLKCYFALLPFLRNDSAGAGGAVCAVLYADGVPLELAVDFFFLSFCLDIGSLSFMDDERSLEHGPLKHHFLPGLDIPAPTAKEEASGAGFALSFFGFFFSRLLFCSRLAMAYSLLICGRHLHLHRGMNAAGASQVCSRRHSGKTNS